MARCSANPPTIAVFTFLVALVAGSTITLAALPIAAKLLPKHPNYQGDEIPASAGLIFLPIILLTLVMLLAGMTPGVRLTEGLAFLLYSLMAGAVGFADDVWGGTGARGFRGHFRSLLQGQVTTGIVKVVALGGGALVYAVAVADGVLATLFAAFLMTGFVNLANLFDVRPGRMLKFMGLGIFALLIGVPVGVVAAAAPVVGGAMVLFYFDVRGRIMLGDAGAAVIGAVAGHLVVSSGPGMVWWICATVIFGLTVLAEVSSISKVIEEVGILRRLDLWGRG